MRVARYALLLYYPNATRAWIESMGGTEAARCLQELLAKGDEENRYAYLRNRVREQNAAAPEGAKRLERLAKEDEEEVEDGEEKDEKEFALKVGYDGVVTRTEVPPFVQRVCCLWVYCSFRERNGLSSTSSQYRATTTHGTGMLLVLLTQPPLGGMLG